MSKQCQCDVKNNRLWVKFFLALSLDLNPKLSTQTQSQAERRGFNEHGHGVCSLFISPKVIKRRYKMSFYCHFISLSHFVPNQMFT